MAEPDLLPCPFCGEELEFSENLSIHGGGWMHHGDEANRDKPCFLVGKIVYNTPGDLDRWNCRTPTSDQTNAEVSDERLPVDELAQEIRRVDGNHDLGAGALAEALMPFLNRRSVTSQASEETREDEQP